MQSQPLSGKRVVDFGQLLPCPYVSRLLGDLGADVVAVQPPSGDPAASILPGLAPHLSRGKDVVRIDLKQDGGLDRALDLVATADVVLEGFRPGVAERLGIGFEAVSARRPGVVYCSISGYGQSGPRRTVPAHDSNIQAAAGAFAGAIAAGAAPTTPYLPVADLSASMFAAFSVVSALLARERDPNAPAVHLDVSMEETMLALALPRWGQFLQTGTEPAAADLIAYSAGAGVFRTADGRHVAVAAIEDHFWAALCDGIGRPELAAAPYDSLAGRTEERSRLRGEVAVAVAATTSDTLMARLGELGVPVTLVRTASEVSRDEHLRERGAIEPAGAGIRVHHPVLWSGVRPGAEG
jgi:crotonobetainyl-CoA:carnitine CoA-transferase CaiB-like acyl-CoA transferase